MYTYFTSISSEFHSAVTFSCDSMFMPSYQLNSVSQNDIILQVVLQVLNLHVPVTRKDMSPPSMLLQLYDHKLIWNSVLMTFCIYTMKLFTYVVSAFNQRSFVY
ncbi:uncharacterized protein LOC126340024 [Schistocerca gregaria]|uniref:uncharacterized protein LOC126340024 n=1 Tax=Schistocerca gregaria TaxID=7010 RepID=UPI00211E71E7|nr:uncharacterized protein LOC126340024 [Schistocerca gregaria]